MTNADDNTRITSTQHLQLSQRLNNTTHLLMDLDTGRDILTNISGWCVGAKGRGYMVSSVPYPEISSKPISHTIIINPLNNSFYDASPLTLGCGVSGD